MKTNSSVLSGKFWLAAVTVALFLLPVTAAAQAGNGGRDRRGDINRGRVGVTTVEPGGKLDLNTKLKIRSGGFFLENTALLRASRGHRVIPTSPPFDEVVLGTTNSGDFLVFKAGGTERARISTDGNVGIGTTNPLYTLTVNSEAASNFTALALTSGDIGTPGRVIEQRWGFHGNTYQKGAFYFESQDGAGRGKFHFALNDAATSANVTTSDIRMTIDYSGNVGIGTTNPLYALTVNSEAASNFTALALTSGDMGAAGRIIEQRWGFHGNTYQKGAFYFESQDGAGRGKFHFALNDAATSANVTTSDIRMTIDYSGNVGIGTTSPGQKFEVGGGFRISGAAMLASAFPAGIFSFEVPVLREYIGDGSGYSRTFSKRAGSSTTDLVTILDSGNVGIGTTGPGQRLQVSGGVHISGAATLASALPAGIFSFEVPVLREYIGDGSGYSRTFSKRAGSSTTDLVTILDTGRVGIGTPSPEATLHVQGTGKVTGNLTVDGNISAKYQDVAEWVESSEQLAAGTVVVLDSTKSNQVTSSSVSYDTRVAGVISAQPGITLGEKADNKVLVATTGRVKVKVDASKGPIHIGDLLVTSDVPGVAMKSEPVELAGRKMHMPGTLIGKALEPLEKGSGEILVLLSLQ